MPSVITLSRAAFRVLFDIYPVLKPDGDFGEALGGLIKGMGWTKFNEITNQLKHADNDAEAMIDPHPVHAMVGIGLAVTLYHQLTGSRTPEMQAFETVMSMLFATMSIPPKYQHRVLFWGIFGALALRAIFIVLGSALISQFWWLMLLFGAFLVYTGAKIIRHRADEGDGQATRGLGLLRKILPVTDELDGQKFVTRINARRAATPLLAALVVVEFTDIIFAVDSVPAVLAVSNESYLVFASNAFAILGLRAMYFLLANAKERFHYLSHALGGILIFVGLKMSVSHWYHMNTYVSLAVIVAMLIAAIVFSQRRRSP